MGFSHQYDYSERPTYRCNFGHELVSPAQAILNTDLRTIKLSYDHEEVLLSIPVAIPAKPIGRVYEAIIPEIQDIPVVCEFSDVFPEDLSGLPPERCRICD